MRADASTPTDWLPWRSVTTRRPSAATRRAVAVSVGRGYHTRGAGGEAASAYLTLRLQPGAATRRHDARLRAAALERERRAHHHLLRVAHAARAQDARVGVIAHQLVAVVVQLALRIREDERRLGAELARQLRELVRPAARIRVQVLCEQHLRERAAQPLGATIRGDDHPGGDACGTGGNGAR